MRARPTPTNRRYRQLIEGEFVDEIFDLGLNAIDELFSEDKRPRGPRGSGGTPGRTEVTEVELPYPTNVMPITAIPMGGGQDCLMIWESQGTTCRSR